MSQKNARYIEVELSVLFRRTARVTVKVPEGMSDEVAASLTQTFYNGDRWEEDESFQQPRPPLVVGESDDEGYEDLDFTGGVPK